MKTRCSFKVAGLVLLVVLSLVFWAVPVEPSKIVWFWFCRLASPLGAITILMHLRKADRDPKLKDLLATIEPANDFTCPVCGTPLMASSVWTCPQCGIQRC